MVEFFKTRFGYGLAGLFVGLVIVAAYTNFSSKDNISGLFLVIIALVGLVFGLVFPSVMGKVFTQIPFSVLGVNYIRRDQRYTQKQLEEVQKGPTVIIIRVFGVLILLFLIFIIFRSI